MQPHKLWGLIRELNLHHEIQEQAWLSLESTLRAHAAHREGRFEACAGGKYGLRASPGPARAQVPVPNHRPEPGPRSRRPTPRPPEGETPLDVNLLLEADLHRWLFRNLQRNGLRELGLGPLEVYDDRRQGLHNLGKFNTRSAGEIDMLLRTREGDLLVIEIKRRGVDEAVGQICRYMGWVSRNLRGRRVLGLIIAQEITDRLRYAVQAAGPNLRVQRLRIHAELGRRSS